MPSLFRLLFVIGVICGVVFGVMMALVTFVEPEPREMSIVVPPEKLQKR